MPEAPPLVALFGATALGKTEVAVELAGLMDADIVVADSMQLYAGLPILTNQPSAAQRARARHHLVGLVPPQRESSVAEYALLAHEVIDGLRARGRAVIVEGGSGLYLRAALGDLTFGAPPDEALRREFDERWTNDRAGLLAEVHAAHLDAPAQLDAANPRRVLRAFEALRAGGAPSAGRLWLPAERYPHRLIALVPEEDRAALKARIDVRVDEMLAAGALDEVAQARRAGPLSPTALQAIGVRELCSVLDGELQLAEAAVRMKARTRGLARRQLTWLRKLPAAALVPAAGRPPAAVAADVLALAKTAAW
jgi:tRNA dimethylallyltransferase